jgi:hypothetical protein
VTAQDDEVNEETNKLVQLIERQATVEANLAATQSNCVALECTPPPVCHDFQTSRLFLSHFGLLSLGDEENSDGAPALTALDSSSVDFCKDLSVLDHLSPRTCDTVHIFYVKSQQVDAQDIVNNVRNENCISPCFFEFIHTLGWPVEVNKHPGWTGHVSTSWKVSPQEASTSARSTTYDGSSHVLYWADACSEIAFVVPSTVKTSEPPSEQSSFNASCKLKVASFHSSLPCCSLVRKKLVGDQR